METIGQEVCFDNWGEIAHKKSTEQGPHALDHIYCLNYLELNNLTKKSLIIVPICKRLRRKKINNIFWRELLALQCLGQNYVMLRLS